MDARGGRPRKYTEQSEPMRAVSARLTHWHVRAAKKIGQGKLSEGIRQAIEIAESQLKEKK